MIATWLPSTPPRIASTESLPNSTHRLIAAFLAARTPRTLQAYRDDLERFRRFVGASTLDEAAARLLVGGLGSANELVLAWRANMIEGGAAPATVNRRLAAVRSLVRFARVLGLAPWTLEVPSLRSRPYRDTRGPGREGVARLLAELDGGADPRSVRNRLLVRVLYDLALRRAEAAALDIEHVDLERRQLRIVGKGRLEPELLTLPERTLQALRDWLELRPDGPAGPLFVALDRPGRTTRLSATSIYRIVRGLGEDVGIRARPHGLRHTAITEALNLTSGDVRAVARYSRHQDIRTVQRYDDSREDLAGGIANRVSDSV